VPVGLGWPAAGGVSGERFGVNALDGEDGEDGEVAGVGAEAARRSTMPR